MLIRLEWHPEVNVEVRCELSVLSRKIVDLVLKLNWFQNWERNYPLSPSFT